MKNIHYRKVDYRIESLEITISGLENSIAKLRERVDAKDYYDGLWLLEESEPIFGLAFVAVQNYINSSIYDRFENLDDKSERYKLGEIINDFARTDIELIISIANYFKHRDDAKDLHRNTTKTLQDFNFQFDKDINLENSPIIKGLEIFSKDLKFGSVIHSVKNWREKLWEDSY